jgi:hypothetical protein
MSLSTVIIVSLLYGGLIGLASCIAYAVFVKRYNLGIFANVMTGVLIGGPALLCAVLMDMPLIVVVAASVIASIAIMTLIGAYLNHRAR